MASDRPEQNDAEQDEKNTDENDLQEIEDLKIQGKTFLIDNKLGVFPSVLHTHFRCTMHIDQNKTISIKTQLIIHIPIIYSHPELSVLISPARHYLCQGHTLRTLSILKVFLYQDVSPELMIKHPLQVRNHKKISLTDGHNFAQNAWTLWFFKNDKTKQWEENQREIITFNTVTVIALSHVRL